MYSCISLSPYTYIHTYIHTYMRFSLTWCGFLTCCYLNKTLSFLKKKIGGSAHNTPRERRQGRRYEQENTHTDTERERENKARGGEEGRSTSTRKKENKEYKKHGEKEKTRRETRQETRKKRKRETERRKKRRPPRVGACRNARAFLWDALICAYGPGNKGGKGCVAAYIVHERWWRNGDNLGVHERMKTDVYLSPPFALVCLPAPTRLLARRVYVHIYARLLGFHPNFCSVCVGEVRACNRRERALEWSWLRAAEEEERVHGRSTCRYACEFRTKGCG